MLRTFLPFLDRRKKQIPVVIERRKAGILAQATASSDELHKAARALADSSADITRRWQPEPASDALKSVAHAASKDDQGD